MQRLIHRRFVPFYFDMFPGGFASDGPARAAIGKLRPALKKNIGVNPVFFLSPDGKIVGETTVMATTKKLLAKMHKLLERHPELARPTAAERSTKSVLARANVAIDLGEYDKASQLLTKSDLPRAHYLAGHVARLQRDWSRMEKELAQVRDPSSSIDVRMERSHELWAKKKYERLVEQVATVPKPSARYTEARYYLGLAKHKLGKAKVARALWKATIRGTKQHDRWIYRMDWAYAGTRRRSLIGRIQYYLANPDLGKR